jgi:Na+-transporting NADH:ubiquinone oxidoreductase subunit F
MMLFLKKLHKWISLLIGLQVLLWLLSGLVISLLDPAKVSGQQWVNSAPNDPETLPPGALLEPDELAAEHLNGALGINLAVANGKPVYRIRYVSTEVLLDAIDGSVLTTGKAAAERLALRDFNGIGKIISVTPGTAPNLETRNSNGNYWRVDFSDNANTAIYISAASGDILERRNSYWRVHDFFWMLHIMDYSAREDFNNALVIIVSLIAVWLGITGFILLFGSFGRRDFRFLKLPGNTTGDG